MDSFSAWDVLDMSPKSSTAEIKARYRSLVLMYHPDKCNLSFIGPDYFHEIQKAYKTIMSTRRDARMPKHDIDYQDIEQELDYELRGILKENFNVTSETQREFNDAFNKRFMETNKAFDRLRPLTMGYSDFNRIPTSDDIIKKFSVDDIKYKKIERRETEVSKPLKPIFDIKNSGIYGLGVPAPNFGIIKIEDFSVKCGTKKSLSSGDLGKVFSKNVFHEYVPNEMTLEKKIKERKEDYEFPTVEEAEKIISKQQEKNDENASKIQEEEILQNKEYLGIFQKIQKAIGWN